MKKGVWFLGGILFIAVMVSLLVKNLKDQPVPFNHKKHVDFGIACDACHVGAKDSVKATIPNVETCALCHIPLKENPKTPKALERYIQEMKEIPWRRIYQVPAHVQFSHKRHVEMGGIECKVCHGEIETMEKAMIRQPVPLPMEGWVSCHREEKITTDCLACHR